MEIVLEYGFHPVVSQRVDFQYMIYLLIVSLPYKSKDKVCIQEAEFCLCDCTRLVSLKQERINALTLDWTLLLGWWAFLSEIVRQIPNQNSFLADQKKGSLDLVCANFVRQKWQFFSISVCEIFWGFDLQQAHVVVWAANGRNFIEIDESKECKISILLVPCIRLESDLWWFLKILSRTA